MPRKKAAPTIPIDGPATGQTDKTWQPKDPADRNYDNYVDRNVDYKTYVWLSNTYPKRDRLMWRLYRWWPIIDRKLSSPVNPKNIASSPEPIFKEDILKQWGAGIYGVRLNDEGRHPSAKEPICVCRIDLSEHQQEYAPVLDVQELVMTAPRNRSYVEGLIARGLLRKDGDKIMPNTGGSADPAVVGQILQFAQNTLKEKGNKDPEAMAIGKYIDVMASANDKVLQHVLKNTAGAGSSESAVMPLIVAMVQSQNQMNQTLLTLLLKSNQQPAGGGLESAVALLKSMADTFGIGKGNKHHESAMELFVNKIPEMLNGIAGIAATYRTGADPFSVLTGAPGADSGAVAPAPAPSNPAGAPGTRSASGITLNAVQLRGLAKAAFEKINEQITGQDYAHAIRLTYSLRTYYLIAGLGKDYLVSNLIAVEPALGGMRSQLEAFVESFISYAKTIEEPPDNNDDEGEDPDNAASPQVN